MSNSSTVNDKYVFLCPNCGAYKPTVNAVKTDKCTCVHCKNEAFPTDLILSEYRSLKKSEKDAAFEKFFRASIIAENAAKGEVPTDFKIKTVTKHKPWLVVLGCFIMGLVETMGLQDSGAVLKVIVMGVCLVGTFKMSEYKVTEVIKAEETSKIQADSNN